MSLELFITNEPTIDFKYAWAFCDSDSSLTYHGIFKAAKNANEPTPPP